MSHINLLHIGINNLDDQQPKDISLDLKELAESFHNGGTIIKTMSMKAITDKSTSYQVVL